MFEPCGADFSLKLDRIYAYNNDVKIEIPVNGSFTISIETNIYKGTSELEIDIRDFELFFRSFHL